MAARIGTSISDKAQTSRAANLRSEIAALLSTEPKKAKRR
jgi:hypothetical protein